MLTTLSLMHLISVAGGAAVAAAGFQPNILTWPEIVKEFGVIWDQPNPFQPLREKVSALMGDEKVVALLEKGDISAPYAIRQFLQKIQVGDLPLRYVLTALVEVKKRIEEEEALEKLERKIREGSPLSALTMNVLIGILTRDPYLAMRFQMLIQYLWDRLQLISSESPGQTIPDERMVDARELLVSVEPEFMSDVVRMAAELSFFLGDPLRGTEAGNALVVRVQIREAEAFRRLAEGLQRALEERYLAQDVRRAIILGGTAVLFGKTLILRSSPLRYQFRYFVVNDRGPEGMRLTLACRREPMPLTVLALLHLIEQQLERMEKIFDEMRLDLPTLSREVDEVHSAVSRDLELVQGGDERQLGELQAWFADFAFQFLSPVKRHGDARTFNWGGALTDLFFFRSRFEELKERMLRDWKF